MVQPDDLGGFRQRTFAEHDSENHLASAVAIHPNTGQAIERGLAKTPEGFRIAATVCPGWDTGMTRSNPCTLHGGTTMQKLMKTGKIILIIVFGVVFSSCTSYKVVDMQDEFKNKIQKGDAVRIITKDGRELVFKITDINEESILGGDQHISFDEIARMERRKISKGKTAALGGGVIVGGFLAFATAMAIAFVSFIGSMQ